MNDRAHRCRTLKWLALAVLIGLSGCTDPPDPPSDAPQEVDASGTPEQARCEESCGTDDPGVPAPSWVEGQWWEWTVAYQDRSFSLRTTVASLEEDVALVGSTGLDEGLAAVWFHLPPLGPVDVSELSWIIHDEPVSLLRFPLTNGMSWTGSLEGSEIQMTSERLDDGRYSVQGVYEGGRIAVRVEYDPEAQVYSSIELLYGGSEPWSSAALTDYGVDEQQESSHIPTYHDLLIGWAAAPEQPVVADSFEIAETIDHIVVGCSTRGAPGVFAVVLHAPETEHHPCPRAGPVFPQEHDEFDLLFIEASPGEWRYQIMGTAEGFVNTEILAVSMEQS